MSEFTNKLDPQCCYFNLLSLQLFLQPFFVHTRAGAMAGIFTNHYSHRNCCIWVSAVLFAFPQSPDKMFVDEARELKKKTKTHSSISLQLHPRIEKAPEHPQSPHEVQHTPVTPTSHLWLLLRPGKGLCLGGAQAPAQPPHCPAWIFYIYFSLPSFAVAVVNLPFSKFNKTLIEKEKKKEKEKGHFKPNNKRPIDFSIF